MKKACQQVVDKDHGDCMQAVMASLFELPLEKVPEFIKYKEWFEPFWNFLKSQGYEYIGMRHNRNYSNLMTPTEECFRDFKFVSRLGITPKCLYKYNGINGYFYASVLSPKYFNWSQQTTHAVIIDRDLNIVHDPSPSYKDLKRYPLSRILGYNGLIDLYLIEKI